MGGGQLRQEAVDARVEPLPMMPASNFDFCSVCAFRARFTEQGPVVVTRWACTPKGALGPWLRENVYGRKIARIFFLVSPE
jgi:hypothetical protein